MRHVLFDRWEKPASQKGLERGRAQGHPEGQRQSLDAKHGSSSAKVSRLPQEASLATKGTLEKH